MPVLWTGNRRSLELSKYSYPFFLGFAATSFQILILREFETYFYGNELVYGFVLAFWLLGGGIGSLLAEKKFSPAISQASFYVFSFLVFTICLILLRFSRFFFGFLPAEMTGLSPVIISSLLISLLVSLPLGALFVYNVFWLDGQLIATYQLESLGAAAGGLTVYLLLIPLFSNWQAAAAVILLIGTVLWLIIPGKKILLPWLFALVLSAGLWLFDFPTEKIYWKPFLLVEARDSIYSRLQVVKSEDQISFFTNNLLAFNYPDPAAAEETVHFALLQRPEAHRVLLIGGGLNGTLEQLLQYPQLQIDYVELDPLLIDLALRHLQDKASVLNNPRVFYHIEDGRRFIQKTDQAYEVIISNLPEPATTQVNRFYTVEFFFSVKKKLTSDGVFSFILPSSENYLSEELTQFLASIYYSLEQVFQKVMVIPGENNVFLASDGNIDDSLEILVSRLEKLNLQTVYFRPELLFNRLHPFKKDYLMNRLNAVKNPRLNSDLTPISYFFTTILWGKQFKGWQGKLLNFLHVLPRFWLFDLPILILLILMIILIVKKNLSESVCLLPLAIMGFTTIMSEIGLILAFQAKLGLVYGKISLLFTMFMLGLFLGSTLMKPYLQRVNLKYLIAAQAGFVFLLAAAQTGMTLSSETIFYFLLLAMGILGGMLFVASNSIFLRSRIHYGLGYALDLFGSFAGALIATSIFIPLLGLNLLFSFLLLVNSFCLLFIIFKGLIKEARK